MKTSIFFPPLVVAQDVYSVICSRFLVPQMQCKNMGRAAIWRLCKPMWKRW